MAPTGGSVGAILAVLAFGLARSWSLSARWCRHEGLPCVAEQYEAAAPAADRGRKGITMAAIEALVLVAAAGFAFIAVASLVVIIIGIHQEERHWTFAHGDAPTGVASMSRRVLGAHCDPRFAGLWVESAGHDARTADTFPVPR
jgi:hypothetical protein